MRETREDTRAALQELRALADEWERDEMDRFGGHVESAEAERIIGLLRRAASLRLADDEGALRAVADSLAGDDTHLAYARDMETPRRLLAALDRHLSGEQEAGHTEPTEDE